MVVATPCTSSNPEPREAPRDAKTRLKKVRLLIGDPDERISSLVYTVLRSFGFEQIDVVRDGESMLQVLHNKDVDLLVSEWDLRGVDGIRLIQLLRNDDKQRWHRDLPAIILTGKADLESVRKARDAGFTEFVAKPFSAKSLSTRLLQIIDNPRQFIISPSFNGPCRRRRSIVDFDTALERRGQKPEFQPRVKAEGKMSKIEQEAQEKATPRLVEILPPNMRLIQLIGDDVKGSDIFTEKMIAGAQDEIKKKESEFLEWADSDIRMLEACYAKLRLSSSDEESKTKLLAAAYSLKSQAGIFGYDMGTEVSRMLLDYLPPEKPITEQSLVVLRKFLDTISVVFRLKVKEAGGEIGAALIRGLQILVKKLG